MEPSELERFEAVVLPQMDAAYGLARYLMRNDADADDVVQEALLRALRYFGGFQGPRPAESRAWVLAIVRNTASTWRRRHRAGRRRPRSSTRHIHSETVDAETPRIGAGAAGSRARSLAQALDRLPRDLREVIVLREIEGLSYKEIGDVDGRAHRHGHVPAVSRPQAAAGGTGRRLRRGAVSR